MPITQEQREARQAHIGGSDAGAVMGVDPSFSRHDCWASKVLPLEPEDTEKKPWLELGNELEGMLVAWGARQVGVKVEREVTRTGENPIMEANLDGLSADGSLIFEAKTCGISNYSPDWEDFGEEGTDDLPPRVLCQATHQLYCVPEAERVYVPALIGGRGRVLFHVDRDNDFVAMLLEACLEFWNLYVVPRVLPAGPPPLEVLKRLERNPGPWVKVPDALWEDFDRLRQERLRLEKEEKLAKAALVASLGNREVGYTEESRRLFSFLNEEKKGYTVEPSEGRVFRYRKLKKSEIKELDDGRHDK